MLSTVKSAILHPHVRRANPESPALLAIRTAYVRFWKANPPDSAIIGIASEATQWSLLSKTAPWYPTRKIHSRILAKRCMTAQQAGYTWLTDCNTRLNASVCDGNGTRAFATIFTPPKQKLPVIELVIARDLDGVITLRDSAVFITAIVVFVNRLYLVSSLGTVFDLNITTIYDDLRTNAPLRINFLHRLQSKKQFDIPRNLPGLVTDRFRLSNARTIDGDTFLFLTEQGFLLSGRMNQTDKTLAIVSRNVQSFMMMEQAALCTMKDHSLFILNLGDPAEIISTRLADNADVFMTHPELRAMWAASARTLKSQRGAVNIAF